VDEIAVLLNRLWCEREGEGEGQGGFTARKSPAVEEGGDRGDRGRAASEERIRRLWARLLDAERVFWPVVGEDGGDDDNNDS
jgi:hypothetical protein